MPFRSRWALGWRIAGVIAGVAWVAAMFVFAFTADPEGEAPPDTVTVQPIESYDSADLRRVADALEALETSRLTPEEHETVAAAADIIGSVVSGDATISTAATTAAPPPITTTTTSSTPPPSSVPTVADFSDALNHQDDDG